MNLSSQKININNLKEINIKRIEYQNLKQKLKTLYIYIKVQLKKKFEISM